MGLNFGHSCTSPIRSWFLPLFLLRSPLASRLSCLLASSQTVFCLTCVSAFDVIPPIPFFLETHTEGSGASLIVPRWRCRHKDTSYCDTRNKYTWYVSPLTFHREKIRWEKKSAFPEHVITLAIIILKGKWTLQPSSGQPPYSKAANETPCS